MKAFKIIIVTILFTVCSLSHTSCVIVHKHDSGNHKGWNKNSNNPHHPNTTNPGHTKEKKEKKKK